jgi:hypothetical protein
MHRAPFSPSRDRLDAHPAPVGPVSGSREGRGTGERRHLVLEGQREGRLFAEVNKASGRFHAKAGNPLYLFVYDLNGVVLAHGSEANLIGVNRFNVKDSDGKQYIKEAIALAQKKSGGWAGFKRMNPDSKKIEHKTSFCLAENGVVLGCGIYQ